MDPTANLNEQTMLAQMIQGCAQHEHKRYRDLELLECVCRDRAERLAELVLSLDEWIRRGGFVPQPWAAAGVVPREGGR